MHNFPLQKSRKLLKGKFLSKIITFFCFKLLIGVDVITILITLVLLFLQLAVMGNSDGLLMPPLERSLNSAQRKIIMISKHFNKLTEA